MKRKTKLEKEQNKQQAIASAQAAFFGGMTKTEALEVFKVLAILAQFPGANPPEPLNGCEVTWSSLLKVGDSLAQQRFNVQVIYRDMTFIYTVDGGRLIQLPDGTFMAIESWDYQAILVANRVS